MSEQVQFPPTTHYAPRVAPVRAPDPVEPPKKSQTDNREANDHRSGDDQASRQASTSAAERHLAISREPALQSFVYRSIDIESGDVVWQFPAEQVLRRARHMRELEEQRQQEHVDKRA